MRQWRDAAWRLAGGVAAGVVAAVLPFASKTVLVIAGVPIGGYDCATQVCPYNTWLAALALGCWC